MSSLVVKGECCAKTIDLLTVGNSIGFPGGIEVTPAGKVVIADQINAVLYTYNVRSKSGHPPTFSFTQNASDVWTADAQLSAAVEFAYPAGGSPLSTIAVPNQGQPIGIVVTPVQTIERIGSAPSGESPRTLQSFKSWKFGSSEATADRGSVAIAAAAFAASMVRALSPHATS